MTAGTSLEAWLAEAMGRLQHGRDVESVDVDQLTEKYDWPWDLPVAIDLYGRALRVVPEDAPYVVSLAVPLASRDEVDTNLPQLGKVAEALSDVHPPGVYLTHPGLYAQAWPFHEFRAPIAVPVDVRGARNITARYVCFRTPEAADRGWEWERTIWLDRWPERPQTR